MCRNRKYVVLNSEQSDDIRIGFIIIIINNNFLSSLKL